MNDERRVRKNSLEVSSQPLQDELVAIKDRLNAIETIQSISNAPVVRKYVESYLGTAERKKLMLAASKPVSKEELRVKLGYNSPQALDYHLQPLRDADLIRREVREDGTVVFDWSNLFRGLQRSAIRAILEESPQPKRKK